jgi:putative SOS response-associated peptidase YedK
MPPGPDIAPYHDRQIVILERNTWADWLDPSVSAKSLIRPLPPVPCPCSTSADVPVLPA